MSHLTVQLALNTAVVNLQDAGVPDALRDARKLMESALGCGLGRLTLYLHDQIDEQQLSTFQNHIQRREAHVPVSQILGYRDFFGRQFKITPDVLDPRPDTETLIEVALRRDFTTVMDLGVGSGCILLTLLSERSEVQGWGVDASAAALEVARQNATGLAVADRTTFLQSDWFHDVPAMQFDLIVSNPPYIAEAEMDALQAELSHEPKMALTDYGDGLGAYRRICDAAMGYLTPGGSLVFEIGHTQAAAVRALCHAAGFGDITVVQDINGKDRVVTAVAP